MRVSFGYHMKDNILILIDKCTGPLSIKLTPLTGKTIIMRIQPAYSILMVGFIISCLFHFIIRIQSQTISGCR